MIMEGKDRQGFDILEIHHFWNALFSMRDAITTLLLECTAKIIDNLQLS